MVYRYIRASILVYVGQHCHMLGPRVMDLDGDVDVSVGKAHAMLSVS